MRDKHLVFCVGEDIREKFYRKLELVPSSRALRAAVFNMLGMSKEELWKFIAIGIEKESEYMENK